MPYLREIDLAFEIMSRKFTYSLEKMSTSSSQTKKKFPKHACMDPQGV